MFIVRQRTELFRLLLFLAVVAGMTFYVATRFGAWMKASPGARADRPVAGSAERAGGPDAAEGWQSGTHADAANAGGADFFASYRLDRERARAELKETLREVMASGSADAQTKQEAGQRYLTLGHAAEIERRAESLLRAKGFADAIVELSDSHVQVIVRAPQLDRAQAARAIDLVARLTGVQPHQIHIITRPS
jgi:stage III sporulation protein AH